MAPRTITLGMAALLAMATTVQAQDAEIGAQTYNQYCATCHGTGGLGDGPLTDLMTAKVADLTMLTANNDGTFPMLRVLQIIDGRTGMRGHGGDMPVYGALFDGESADAELGSVLYTRGKILSLAYYLENLQK